MKAKQTREWTKNKFPKYTARDKQNSLNQGMVMFYNDIVKVQIQLSICGKTQTTVYFSCSFFFVFFYTSF